jgi:hypothetical protein
VVHQVILILVRHNNEQNRKKVNRQQLSWVGNGEDG